MSTPAVQHLAVGSSGTAAPVGAPVQTIRLMTYNIHHGRGTDGKYDLDRIAEVIASENPDVVALQEIEQHRARTHRDDQPALLAQKLGMHVAFSRVRTVCLRDSHEHAAYGNAILTKFPILFEEHFSLSYVDTLEPRGCLHTTLVVAGQPLHVFCVHLGLRYRERHYQMERLLSEEIVHSPRFGKGPKVLMGDFNNWWPVKSAKSLETHFENACIVTGRRRHGTFNRFGEMLCLDYIFASNDLMVQHFEVVKRGVAKVASDHRPVVCTVGFRNGSIP